MPPSRHSCEVSLGAGGGGAGRSRGRVARLRGLVWGTNDAPTEITRDHEVANLGKEVCRCPSLGGRPGLSHGSTACRKAALKQDGGWSLEASGRAVSPAENGALSLWAIHLIGGEPDRRRAQVVVVHAVC